MDALEMFWNLFCVVPFRSDWSWHVTKMLNKLLKLIKFQLLTETRMSRLCVPMLMFTNQFSFLLQRKSKCDVICERESS